ncbi:hypothetical protein K227x_27050 [Rubripirellula lacrimiformis]|uniref:Enolase C-terminal domain-containing protein n=1 Tax=Rubripirellula lacrimiformis TaxID=1930273 RepID=A0A517NB03_9BACT|nr:mandelate racemase/muconate lactonizing enzyme family protein [Rubripirellula lacrimiformis]QDT04315.1 hypothetical protein K227x_27050 [Rubripirellula lacrimiformis]
MPSFRKPTDVRVESVDVHYLPVQMRMPLKFGPESVTSVTCVRVAVTVVDADGKSATGWGETPLSVTWAWPSATMTYADRYDAMTQFCAEIASAWKSIPVAGHPMEIGHAFLDSSMHQMLDSFNANRGDQSMPHLAALITASAFDIATHDAYGQLHDVDIYDTYNSTYMSDDLATYLTPESGPTPESATGLSFEGQFPSDYLVADAPTSLPVWHLVGGLDPLEQSDLSGSEPDDGYPVTLRQWIAEDGLTCLKVKLRGNDAAWDFDRLVRVGEMSLELGIDALSADFNCTAQEAQYVNDILDQLKQQHPAISDLIIYVEQPFPYDLEKYQIDVHSVSQRKPLFLDESAHDWRFVALGKRLGWTGVALKTCKTQTGALLSLCWAKAHGMPLMVQDLTNPMLAQIPHVRLAAHAGTIMGVESNGMQFYPDASAPEAKVHPGIYRRRDGKLDLSTLSGPGFGYRLDEIERTLPPAE